MLALTLALRLRRGATPWSDLILLAVAGGFVLYSIRTLPVAVAMLAPLLAIALAPYTGQPRTSRREVLAVVGGVVGCMAVLALVVPRPPAPGLFPGGLGRRGPRRAARGHRAAEQPAVGRLPDVETSPARPGDARVRRHLHRRRLDRNLDIDTLQPGWDDLVRDTGARVALLDPDSALAYALETGQGWTVVRESDDMVLLAAPADSAS